LFKKFPFFPFFAGGRMVTLVPVMWEGDRRCDKNQFFPSYLTGTRATICPSPLQKGRKRKKSKKNLPKSKAQKIPLQTARHTATTVHTACYTHIHKIKTPMHCLIND
jgi:hypothetical protein